MAKIESNLADDNQRTMPDVVRGGFPEATNAKEFMKSIEEKYKESEKTETGNLMNSLGMMVKEVCVNIFSESLTLLGNSKILRYQFLKPFWCM